MKLRWPSFGRKESQSRVLIAQVATGPYIPTPRDYENFSKEGYQKNVVAYRSISSIASNCGSVPWTLFRKARGARGKKTEITDHPFLDLIDRPNPMQGQASFFEAAVAFKLISGNSYIQAVGPNADRLSKITELWTLRPDRIRIVPGPKGYPLAFEYAMQGRQVRFPVDQFDFSSPVLHWKFFSPIDDWYGMAPLEAAAMSVDINTSANKWNLSLMQNSARPSGALVAQVTTTNSGALAEDQFQRLKKEIEHVYSGAKNAGRPMILEGGLDWKQLSLSPQQMEFIENKNTSARDIALAFGVPPMLLGIPGDNTYANYSEARAALYEDTILPTMESLLKEFNHWLAPAFGDGLEASYDKDEIHALAPRRLAVWDKVQKADWLTVNEKREATGYEEREGGDVILVQSTEMPLEDALADPTEDGTDPGTGQNTGSPGNPGQEPDDGGAKPDEGDADPDADPPQKQLKSVSEIREGKILNLSNDRIKQREARGQLRMRGGFQRKMLRQVQACFDIEGHRVKQAIEGLDAHHAESAARREIEANLPQWKTVLTRNAQNTMSAFGARVFRSVKRDCGPVELKDGAETQYEAFLKKWIAEHVGEAITGISETTKDKVLAAIREAQLENYDEGEGVDSLAGKIEEIYSDFTGSRSMLIARTETGIAANTALHSAAKSTGIVKTKEWVSVNDDRTRPDHIEANGQAVPIDSKFHVGGADMDYPNDPSGPIEEIANCRCCQIFGTEKAADDSGDEGE